jgi:methyltransferase (TIGR00027 family)
VADEEFAKDGVIGDVSDTALWIAWYRAQESTRPDAVFHDRYAARLAGERGRAIAKAMPHGKMMAWVVVARTTGIDRFVLDAIGAGADTVVNLGAGLDTRPYRLALPAGVRWIEVDFPPLIERKTELLRDATPACRLERIGLDLSDHEARRALLARIGGESTRIVVLTEGVLPYLEEAEVRAISADLLAVPGVRWWIQDFYNQAVRGGDMPSGWGARMRAAPFRFRVPDWLGFFAGLGWRVKESVFVADEADRLGRRLPFMFPLSLILAVTPKKDQGQFRRVMGVVMFERGEG